MEDEDTAMDPLALDIEDLKDTSIKTKAKLRDSEQLKRIMNSIEKFEKQPNREGNVRFSGRVNGPLMLLAAVFGPVEEDPEYKLIVEANNIIVEIENEIGRGVCISRRGEVWLTARYLQVSYTSMCVTITRSAFLNLSSLFSIPWTMSEQYK